MIGFLLSIAFALLMVAVAVGLALQIRAESWTSPNSLLLIFVVSVFIVAAILHPQEFYCLMWGWLYFVWVPSAYLLMQIYSVSNVNNTSWGTREVKTVAGAGEPAKPATLTQQWMNRLGLTITIQLQCNMKVKVR
jgi:chitin synthase